MQWLPEGWKPKAVAVDIDGTITDSNKKIHLGAIAALRRLEEAGIPVILATGNVRGITYGLWRFIGASGPMVCENGGVVWHPEWGDPIVRADGGRAKMAAEMVGKKLGLDSQGITTNAWRESEWCLFPDEDLNAINEIISNSEYSDLSVIRTGFAIHLMEPHLSKGEGLAVALAKIGLDASEILAVGDAPNDISMFEYVGHTVAVGGSFEELAAIADVLSPFPHGETFQPLVDAILE
ncbi:MAG: phosphoglycolate phosphatase [Candidatus Poseidoniales archaeon]|nr:phosphoglycolate phosphatase [Candidatus Poseidoniales archaeon]RJV01154.1 MAG: phosphoglycolate phosphatase [Candidatus Poseidoniales archaeon]|tara:strand:+ start:2525 stop:3235 length:711 start_codon:yes stop_codon:yes gene_type:complete